MDSSYFESVRTKFLADINKEKSLMDKANRNKDDNGYAIHYGNVKYIQGKLDCLNAIEKALKCTC